MFIALGIDVFFHLLYVCASFLSGVNGLSAVRVIMFIFGF